jgi:hypothetical protein
MSQTLLPVEPGSFSVLLHQTNEKGAVVDVIPSSVIAWVMDENGIQYALLLTGPVPVHTVPIWGPDGSVVMGHSAWPSIDSYAQWARRRVQ